MSSTRTTTFDSGLKARTTTVDGCITRRDYQCGRCKRYTDEHEGYRHPQFNGERDVVLFYCSDCVNRNLVV